MLLNYAAAPSIGDVSAVLAMDRTTLTANLKPLTRRGLVQVSIDGADRRSRRLTLTPVGRAVLTAAIPVWRKTHATVENLVADADRLRADLRALS